MKAPARDVASDMRHGLCSYCGEPVYPGNAFVEMHVVLDGELRYPWGNRTRGEPIAFFAHADCGPASPYCVPISGLEDQRIVEHFREKAQASSLSAEAFVRAVLLGIEASATHTPGPAVDRPALVEAPVGGGVYFVRVGEFVKIGKASNIRERLRTLQTANPQPIELERFELLDDPGARSSRENELHRRFAHLRVGGEWFHGSLLEVMSRAVIP